jgi:hypothetical protein
MLISVGRVRIDVLEERIASICMADRIRKLGTTLTSLVLSTLKMEAIRSSEDPHSAISQKMAVFFITAVKLLKSQIGCDLLPAVVMKSSVS